MYFVRIFMIGSGRKVNLTPCYFVRWKQMFQKFTFRMSCDFYLNENNFNLSLSMNDSYCFAFILLLLRNLSIFLSFFVYGICFFFSSDCLQDFFPLMFYCFIMICPKVVVLILFSGPFELGICVLHYFQEVLSHYLFKFCSHHHTLTPLLYSYFLALQLIVRLLFFVFYFWFVFSYFQKFLF